MKKKDGVFESLRDYLIPNDLQLDDMSLVQRPIKLKAENSVSILSGNLSLNLLRTHPVMVHAITKLSFEKSHAFSSHQEISLLHNFFYCWVELTLSSENSSTDLLLSVWIEFSVFNDCQNILLIFKGKLGFKKTLHIIFVQMLGNWNAER